MRIWIALTWEDNGSCESGPKLNEILLADLVGYHFETEHRKYRNRWKRERRKLKKLKLPVTKFASRCEFVELHGEEKRVHAEYLKEIEDTRRFHQQQRFAGGATALLYDLFGY